MFSLRGLLCVLLLPLHTVILGIVALIATLVAPGGEVILSIARFWCRIILFTSGVRIHALHPSRARGGPFIVLSNHQSLYDIPALVLTLPEPFRIVVKRELFLIPFFGWALRASGFIGIDRGRRDRAIASLSRGNDALRRGRSLVLFAEGTRSSDGRLGNLKKGAFHLAQQNGVRVLPVTVSGSRAILPRQGYIPRPGEIDVHYGDPMPLIEPGRAIDDALVQSAVQVLQAGFTQRHDGDLDGPASTPGSAASEREPAAGSSERP